MPKSREGRCAHSAGSPGEKASWWRFFPLFLSLLTERGPPEAWTGWQICRDFLLEVVQHPTLSDGPPLCQPIPGHFMAANRGTASKPPRFIRHWQRFGAFPRGGGLGVACFRQRGGNLGKALSVTPETRQLSQGESQGDVLGRTKGGRRGRLVQRADCFGYDKNPAEGVAFGGVLLFI